MHMLTRRLQILLDEDRYQRLARRARARKVSVAEIVREAIDVALPAHWSDRSEAARVILAAEPMPVPEDPADLKLELEELRGRKT